MSRFKSIGIPILTLLLGLGIGMNSSNLNGLRLPNGANKEDIKPKDIEKLNKLTRYIDNNYLGEKGDLAEGMYKGVFKALNDPYSVYMDKKEFSQFKEASSGKFVGIGVIVSPNEDNRIQVVTPIKGGPAEKEGIKAGDILWKVENKEYTGEEIDDAVSIIKGKEGKPVNKTFLRIKKG
ncbi:MAG: PDZ domain-containing protein [Andreesenia angusta]|nr:PDZ domain-containing protein [Andreesenia angusta]